MDEQKVANSILKDIVRLPEKSVLGSHIKIALNSPDIDVQTKTLFNWLLTGKYAQGILSEKEIHQ